VSTTSSGQHDQAGHDQHGRDQPVGPGGPGELAPGVFALFTSRAGGVSAPPYHALNMGASVGDDPAAVTANRRLVAEACGLSSGRLSWMHQVHGPAVSYVAAMRPDPSAPLPKVDAQFTDVPGLAMVVLVADCAPVLLADPQARIVGAAHAGREGMAAGVITELVSAMAGAGADPARMTAAIGPHICGGCYEVPADMRARVAAQEPEAACVTRAGTPGIDVRAGVRAQLARAGVRHVSADPRCTAETPGLYSYRRDGRTGRFAGLIWLAP
jgi:polyphenol oxidase